jgi:putative serine protease PepD
MSIYTLVAPRLLPLIAVSTALVMGGSAAAQELTEARRIEVAERLQAAAVSISVGRSGGSGVVVGDRRWIITNSHVVREARRRGSAVTVHFGDGSIRRGRVLADDRAHDLALVEVIGEVPVAAMPLGDSDRVRVGQAVLAFGSPYGLEGTLTQGIVSARRDLPGSGGATIEGLIQTDAPINPGNSGGPLVNARGEVIGINTAIISRTGGSHGIGFAVPSSYVRELLERVQRELEERSRVARDDSADPPSPRAPPAARTPVWLGILGDDVRTRAYQGVRVRQVVPGGPAAEAGVRGVSDPPPAVVRRLNVPWTGHVILAFDGAPVRTLDDLQQALAARRPGQRAVLTLTVGDGALRGDTTVQLEAPPPQPRGPRRAPRRP